MVERIRCAVRRGVAVAAAASVLALLVPTGQTAAQQTPSISTDPRAVPGEGIYDFTITGSDWTPGFVIYVVPCTVPGEQLTTAHSPDAIDAAMSDLTEDSCTADLIASATVKGDGTFSVEVTHDVSASFAFGAGDAAATERNFTPILFTAANGEVAQTPRDGFSDVTGGVHKPAIETLHKIGLFDRSLCGEHMFCPDDPIDRSTMAVWLARILDGADPRAAASSRFADVDAGSPAAASIERIARLEVTLGCATGPLRYCPDQPVTRGQMASFLVRAFGFEAATAAGFDDTAGTTHEASIDALAAAAVTAGCATDPLRYCPDQPVTRGQMATFLARAHNLVPTSRPGPAFKAVSSGPTHACGLRTGGAITCWGDNRHGKADAPSGVFKAVSAGLAHTCGVRIDGTVECWGASAYGERDAPGGTFQAVSAGQASHGHSICGLRTDGTIACWADNRSGQADAPGGTFRAVSAGMAHTCGLRTDGTITCWGSNYAGKANAPRVTFKAIQVGQNQTYGLRTDGTFTYWGSSVDTPSRTFKFKAFSIGFGFGCGLHTDDTITCWGEFGDIHDPPNPPRGTFKAISAGGESGRLLVCGLRTNDTLICWGNNSYGQAIAPTAAPMSAVGAGFSHSCGLRTDGTITCWGSNAHGQTNEPAGKFSAVTAGTNHSCGLRTNSAVTCWGSNSHGQAKAPTGTFNAVAAGSTHSCGLRTDSTVTCWGSNAHGQADGPAGTFTAVAAGWEHSCGLRTDSTVTCWGSNSYGQAEALTGTFNAVAVGAWHSCGAAHRLNRHMLGQQQPRPEGRILGALQSCCRGPGPLLWAEARRLDQLLGQQPLWSDERALRTVQRRNFRRKPVLRAAYGRNYHLLGSLGFTCPPELHSLAEPGRQPATRQK